MNPKVPKRTTAPPPAPEKQFGNYYYLVPGDKILEGDEVQLERGWRKTAFPGKKVLKTSYPYRREIKNAKI